MTTATKIEDSVLVMFLIDVTLGGHKLLVHNGGPDWAAGGYTAVPMDISMSEDVGSLMQLRISSPLWQSPSRTVHVRLRVMAVGDAPEDAVHVYEGPAVLTGTTLR